MALGLQEMFTRDIVKETVADVKRNLEQGKKGFYDFYERNIFGSGRDQRVMKDGVMVPGTIAKAGELLETIRQTPLKEFIAKSGSTLLQGAAYLIPDKIYQILFDSAVETDVVAAISAAMIGPDGIPGSDLKVDIAVDGSYVPTKFSSGGALPEMEHSIVQATISPLSWGINFNIGNDLIEDSQFDMIEFHLATAGKEMGEYASNEALTILSTAPDGDGTLNSGTSGDANETKFDGYVSDTCVVTHSAMVHSIMNTGGLAATPGSMYDAWIRGGAYPTVMAAMNLVYSNVNVLTNDKGGDNLLTIVFSKQYGIVTARKRWLRIENYSDPVRDLVGATVTARQDSVSLYKDSIFVITET
jgi:hypothetical protein